jgi:hypothetical protein
MGERVAPMKRDKVTATGGAKRSATAFAAAPVLCSLSPAFATTHYELNYRDIVRPNGQPRSDALYNSALDFCYGQTDPETRKIPWPLKAE